MIEKNLPSGTGILPVSIPELKIQQTYPTHKHTLPSCERDLGDGQLEWMVCDADVTKTPNMVAFQKDFENNVDWNGVKTMRNNFKKYK